MAHRTKSFFEQDHSSKKPAQWHRPPKSVLQDAPVNIPPSRPSIPASAKAKSKLNAFQYAPAEETNINSRDGDKENIVGKREDGASRTHDDAATLDRRVGAPEASQPHADITPKLPSLPHANTFPSTPSGRLTLEDLIGNGDEARRTINKVNESPEEQIGWRPHSSAFTPNRKRKRARSSSPSVPNTSSQPLERSASFDDDEMANEKPTPEADPVAALWQAYRGKQAENNLVALPDFHHLIVQASPRPMETPVKGSGLRRWASTGNDWPSAKNKRRCLESGASTKVNIWREQGEAESGSKSKVASMVLKIQESLATQRLEQAQTKPVLLSPDGPASSSPLPEMPVQDSHSLTITSPSNARPKRPVLTRKVSGKSVVSEVPTARSCPVHAPRERSEIVDLPSARSHILQDSVISAPLHLQSKARLPAYKRPSINKVPTPPRAPSAELDEFGDAFDLTADDLDELMSQVPRKETSHGDISPDLQHVQDDRVVQDHARRPPPAPPPQVVTDEDDEFGCDDIDEATFVQAEFSATQVLRKSPAETSASTSHTSLNTSRHTQQPRIDLSVRHSNVSTPLLRYTVKQVIDGEYTNARGVRCPEKILLAEESRESRIVTVTLRGSWVETSVSRDNVIHIAHLAQPFSNLETSATPPGQIFVNDDESSPLMVIHPDHMLSATTVADSFDCVRKAVLQDRIKATGDTNKAMVYGKILHEIFQQSLSANRWDDRSLSELIEATVRNHVEGLWELGMCNTNMAIEEIRAKMGELAAWAKVFVMPEPSRTSLVDDQQGDKLRMSISRLIAIEEHVWSPRYGLKGNIDATVETTTIQTSGRLSKLLAPFEVKTGRTTQSAAHRAQTALYTLLLSDRYDLKVAAGVLYYLESSSLSRIAPPRNEIRQMVQQRNRLASYIHSARNPSNGQTDDGYPLQSQEIETSGLPNPLKNPFKCGKCYANQSCFTYHALAENGTAETAGMMDDARKDHSLVWNEVVGHLMLSAKDQKQAEALKSWFSKWDRLLTLEESEQSKLRKELWTMSSSEREAAGRCFGRLVLARDLTSSEMSTPSTAIDGIEGSGGKINRFAYAFAREHPSPARPFTEGSQLTVGEPMVVSSEKGQWALANGYVVAITPNEITVAVDRKLGTARQKLSDFDHDDHQTFRGIMASGGLHDPSTEPPGQTILYRLDKDEFSNGLALVRNNLVTLMSTHPIHSKLRSQIILGAAPRFASSAPMVSLPPSQLGDMNDDQREAVQKVTSAQDYALILGMPGTGKTTTIAHIIRALLADGQSILLTSFTHTAVDNILMKIRDVAPVNSILRIGVPAKINDRVKEFCQLAATPRATIDEIDHAYMDTQIVAATCMGTNHALFRRRCFDVCIVDEASQITLPTILGPLLHARKFILVGDHYQLPPLVQNRSALAGGLDMSLFRQLSETHPDAVASLGLQYRMCADIMSLPNALIYSGALRCGTPSVATRTLSLPNPHGLDTLHSPVSSSSSHSIHPNLCPRVSSSCWLTHATSPAQPVVFANTDPCGPAARETSLAPAASAGGGHITNLLEAGLTAQLVLALLAQGVPASEIGVIALYRSQLSLLRRIFARAGIAGGTMGLEKVEIDSADRFQGRDKECVVLSMVRSNEAGVVGELLRDWRRVNVGLTRARSKLVILGSWRTLRNNEVLKGLIELVEEKGWGLDLPREVERLHDFGLGEEMVVEEGMEEGKARSEGEGMNVTRGDGRQPLGDLKTGENSRKVARKIIDGRSGGRKMRRLREQMAIEILEDL